MSRLLRALVAALILQAVAACGGSSSPAPSAGPPEPPPPTSPPAGFILSGSPESAQGATWTFRGVVDGVSYDLSGVLMKPPGPGPFPVILVSHGMGGSATNYSRNVGAKMVPWGVVVVATNYTHAAGGPSGAPGGAADFGASAANVLRARQAIAFLATLGYVDMQRVAAHGHSMGAFVTTALSATHPQLLRVASHTAGGVRPDPNPGPGPTETQGRAIRTPYQMHHGDQDAVVALSADQRLAEMLTIAGTVHELVIYPGFDHDDVAFDATMLERVRAWYARHALF